MSQPVIITCAPNGSIHTPTVSEYLPITPNEITEASIGAVEAGPSIIHLHARNPENGRPDPDPELFMQFLSRTKQATGAVMNVSTGGGLGMTREERLKAALRASPENGQHEYGVDEFRHLPDDAEILRLEI